MTIANRPREYLTPSEIDKLIEVCSTTCDRALILLGFRHALRRTELVSLQWDQIDFQSRRIHIKRLKNSKDGVHSLTPREIELLEQLDSRLDSPYFFPGRNADTYIHPDTLWKLMKRLAIKAQFLFPIHPHMLKHATGFKLANEGRDTRAIQGYMGHRNIQNTVTYTELASNRFEDFWNDE